jgi:hypothetical protein
MTDNEANAALAQPKPEGPTDRESFALWEEMRDGMESYPSWRDFDDFARAFLARWGRPAIQPVAVAERLPEPEDCDEEGRCWWGFEGSDDYEPCWALRKMHGIPFDSTHWRPYHALPIPTSQKI